MDIKTSGTITAVNETHTGVGKDGELLATYTLRVNLAIDRSTYLDLVRAKFAGDGVHVAITRQQLDLLDGAP